ncbi:hypothetical protein HAX54_053383, partial [Datura stramonium]|nr:hypothetical protein [Datura stramonium]
VRHSLVALYGTKTLIFGSWLHRGTTFSGCIIGNKNPYLLFIASQGYNTPWLHLGNKNPHLIFRGFT